MAVAVLALGSTGTSAAPSVAIERQRRRPLERHRRERDHRRAAPARQQQRARRHGARGDVRRRRRRGGRSRAVRDGVTAPPGASADAAVAQAARDVLVARVPGQAMTVQAAYDTYMASIPDGPAKDAGKAVGVAAAAGMLAMRTGDHFDDVVPYVQTPPGPGVFEPIAPTPPVDTKLPFVRPFTYASPSDYRPKATARADEQALRAGPGRAAGASAAPTAPLVRRRRPRPSGSTPSRRSSSSTAPCVIWSSSAVSTCASRHGCWAT